MVVALQVRSVGVGWLVVFVWFISLTHFLGNILGDVCTKPISETATKMVKCLTGNGRTRPSSKILATNTSVGVVDKEHKTDFLKALVE